MNELGLNIVTAFSVICFVYACVLYVRHIKKDTK